ncbi:MAG: enoyl-CoA hydratase/isomerase family protein [Pseudomonadota bacterium]
MTAEATCIVARTAQIAHIELNRPRRLNAFSLPAIHQLSAVIDELAADPNLRIVTLRGRGRAFSTGVDLKELPVDGFGPDRVQAWEKMLRTIEMMDKLVICSLHGFAVGGGLQLALACDIRVCARTTQLGLPASKEGIIPGLATYRLARFVGIGRARQLIFSGDLIDAERALDIGLVDHLVDDEGRELATDEIVARYDAAFSAGGRHAKALLADCFNTDFADFLALYERQQGRAVESPDFAEAKAAYAEGRDARWQ